MTASDGAGPDREARCRTCDPSLPVQPGEVVKTAAEWDAEAAGRGARNPSVMDRLTSALICPQCFRLRFSPLHLLTRWAHERGTS